MLDFPNTPTTNQTFTSGGNSWLFDGVKWQSNIAQYSNNVGRNLVHNPLFAVAQRGAGGFTASGALTLDRWRLWAATDAASITQNPNSDASRTAIGDEAASVVLVNTFTGNAAAGAFNFITQAIEGIRRLSGKTVTVSFWAAALAGTPKLGINFQINYGTGGSPSAGIRVLAPGNSVTLSTAWTRYTTTIAIPSAVGKTPGTNGDDYTALEFWFSSGATSNAAAGNIGVQSGTILLWGVQLEVGSIATPLEKPDPQQDLAKCQRFFQTVPVNIRVNATAAQQMSGPIYFSTWMRATPTAATFVTGARGNVGSITVVVDNYAGARINCVSVGIGDAYILDEFWSFSADL